MTNKYIICKFIRLTFWKICRFRLTFGSWIYTQNNFPKKISIESKSPLFLKYFDMLFVWKYYIAHRKKKFTLCILSESIFTSLENKISKNSNILSNFLKLCNLSFKIIINFSWDFQSASYYSVDAVSSLIRSRLSAWNLHICVNNHLSRFSWKLSRISSNKLHSIYSYIMAYLWLKYEQFRFFDRCHEFVKMSDFCWQPLLKWDSTRACLKNYFFFLSFFF